MTRHPWQSDALCDPADIDLFYPQTGVSPRAAKQICAQCPVRQKCLDYALDRNERYGVWGGKTERERRKLRAERATAATVAA